MMTDPDVTADMAEQALHLAAGRRRVSDPAQSPPGLPRASARSPRATTSPALLATSWSRSGTPVADGDVVVVTSKVVSKAEGRVVAPRQRPEADKQAAVAADDRP